MYIHTPPHVCVSAFLDRTGTLTPTTGTLTLVSGKGMSLGFTPEEGGWTRKPLGNGNLDSVYCIRTRPTPLRRRRIGVPVERVRSTPDVSRVPSRPVGGSGVPVTEPHPPTGRCSVVEQSYPSRSPFTQPDGVN